MTFVLNARNSCLDICCILLQLLLLLRILVLLLPVLLLPFCAQCQPVYGRPFRRGEARTGSLSSMPRCRRGW